MKKGKKLRKVGAAIVAMLMVTALAVGMLPGNSGQVLAADKVADLDTTEKYTESLGDSVSTEYTGHI